MQVEFDVKKPHLKAVTITATTEAGNRIITEKCWVDKESWDDKKTRFKVFENLSKTLDYRSKLELASQHRYEARANKEGFDARWAMNTDIEVMLSSQPLFDQLEPVTINCSWKTEGF